MNNKKRYLNFFQNLLITFGFVGIYYAVGVYISTLWMHLFVVGRTYYGTSGEVALWILQELPYWIFCIAAGFFLPSLISSEKIYGWSIILAVAFSLNIILFTTVRITTQSPLKLSLLYLGKLFPFPMCLFGAFLYHKYTNKQDD